MLSVTHPELIAELGIVAVKVGINRAAVSRPGVDDHLVFPEDRLDFSFGLGRNHDLEAHCLGDGVSVLMDFRIRQWDRLAEIRYFGLAHDLVAADVVGDLDRARR